MSAASTPRPPEPPADGDSYDREPFDFEDVPGLEHIATRTDGRRHTGHDALFARAFEFVLAVASEFNGKVPKRVRMLFGALCRIGYDPQTRTARVRGVEASRLTIGLALRPDFERLYQTLPENDPKRDKIECNARQEAKRALDKIDRWQGEPEADVGSVVRPPQHDRVVLLRRERGGQSKRGNLPSTFDLVFLAIASAAVRRVEEEHLRGRAAVDRRLNAIVRELLGQEIAGAPAPVGVRAGVRLPRGHSTVAKMKTATTKVRRAAEDEATTAVDLKSDAQRAEAAGAIETALLAQRRAEAARLRAEERQALATVLEVASDQYSGKLNPDGIAWTLVVVVKAVIERMPLAKRASIVSTVIEQLCAIADTVRSANSEIAVMATKDVGPDGGVSSDPTPEPSGDVRGGNSDSTDNETCTSSSSVIGTCLPLPEGAGAPAPDVDEGQEASAAEELLTTIDVLESVGCERFGISLLDPEGGRLADADRAAGEWAYRVFTADELRANAEMIVRRAERDRLTVSLRYKGEDFGGEHGICHVEDVPDDIRAYLESAALLTVETSPGSAHVLIALAKADGSGRAVDDALTKTVQERLGRKFTAWGVNEGARGGFRAPSTLNLKAKHLRADGTSPRVHVASLQPGRRILVEELDAVGLLAPPKPASPRRHPPRRTVGDSRGDWPDYAVSLSRAPRHPVGHKYAGQPDEAKAMFGYTVCALNWGWSAAEVEAKLPTLSDWLARRQESWIRNQVKRAAAKADRVGHQLRRDAAVAARRSAPLVRAAPFRTVSRTASSDEAAPEQAARAAAARAAMADSRSVSCRTCGAEPSRCGHDQSLPF